MTRLLHGAKGYLMVLKRPQGFQHQTALQEYGGMGLKRRPYGTSGYHAFNK